VRFKKFFPINAEDLVDFLEGEKEISTETFDKLEDLEKKYGETQPYGEIYYFADTFNEKYPETDIREN